MTRLRRSSWHDPGWRRIRQGRGFRYVDERGRTLGVRKVERVKELVIPPAWDDVWICPEPHGHLQAVGVDEAGRRQYLYHPEWRVRRDVDKYDRVLDMARRLPAVRRTVRRRMGRPELDETTVVATAIALIDDGCFRIGSDAYTDAYGSYGLTSLQRRHVTRKGGAFVFDFVGKSEVEQLVVVDDPVVVRAVSRLIRGRRQDASLIDATPAVINEAIASLFGMEVSAKDFRTWNATVTVAASLAAAPPAETRTAKVRVTRAAMQEAADLLGNTVTVARNSYVDPRVVDRYEQGVTIGEWRGRNALDRAVVTLIDG